MYILLYLSSSSFVRLIPSSLIFPSSSIRRFRVSATTLGCSFISLSMKCSYPPFSASSTLHVIFMASRLTSLPSLSLIVIESGVQITISSFSIKNISFVYFSKAGISEAMKLLFFPRPAIKGASLR